MRSSLKLNYHAYDYDKAHAYDTLTSLEKKSARGYKVSFNNKYLINQDWILNIDLKYRDEKSTDKRYEYKETVVMSNIRYRF